MFSRSCVEGSFTTSTPKCLFPAASLLLRNVDHETTPSKIEDTARLGGGGGFEGSAVASGPYVDVADLGNAEALRRSLAGVRSVIVPAGKFDESFAKSCKESGVKHIVLLSTAKASKGNVLSMLLEDEGARARKDDKREQLAKSLDIPLTIIRPVNVVDEPTRGKMMTFSKEEGRLSGTISIEDVAVCAVRALAQPPKKGGGVFAFEIATSNETGKTDWKGQFAMLKA